MKFSSNRYRGLLRLSKSNMGDESYKRWRDRRTNPCSEEAKASFKCLDENNYNRRLCEVYFEAYRECKKAWNARKAERRRQGIHPDDP